MMISFPRFAVLCCLWIGLLSAEEEPAPPRQAETSAFKVSGFGNDYDGVYQSTTKTSTDGYLIYTNGTRFYDTGTNHFYASLEHARTGSKSSAPSVSTTDLELAPAGQVRSQTQGAAFGFAVAAKPAATPSPAEKTEESNAAPVAAKIVAVPISANPDTTPETEGVQESSEDAPIRIKATPIILADQGTPASVDEKRTWLSFLKNQRIDKAAEADPIPASVEASHIVSIASPVSATTAQSETPMIVEVTPLEADAEEIPAPSQHPSLAANEPVLVQFAPSEEAPAPKTSPETPLVFSTEEPKSTTEPMIEQIGAEEPSTSVLENQDAIPNDPPANLLPTSHVEPRYSSWRNRYELGPGDLLNFGLHGKPTLKKLNVAVAPDGTVSFLQAKQVDVRRKTIDELRSEIDQILAPYHRNARTIITPASLGSKKFTVLGEVRKNGTFALDRPTSLLNALAGAGGFNLGRSGEGAVQLADLQRSFIVRNGTHMNVDMEALYLAGDISQNIHIEPNDYIYIASKLRNEVYVFGSVVAPGVKPLESRMTTLGAIAAAEGFTGQAWRDRVLIIRGKMDSPETIVMPLNKVLHGKATDIELLPGDIIYVHNRPWAYASRVLDTAILAYIDGSFAGFLAGDADIAITPGG